jgi:hypothetical protein
MTVHRPNIFKDIEFDIHGVRTHFVYKNCVLARHPSNYIYIDVCVKYRSFAHHHKYNVYNRMYSIPT